MKKDGSAALHSLATAAGLLPIWQDVFGQTHQVGEDSLRSLLTELGFPCDSQAQRQDSYLALLDEAAASRAPATGRLWVVDSGQPFEFHWQGSLSYQLVLESGHYIEGTAAQPAPGLVRIPAVSELGYHALHIGNACLSIAVCPQRCPSPPAGIEPEGLRAWGIAAQLYSLRRAASPEGAGDFSLLAELAAQAGRAGASALAISPVHAMFSAAPARYSPYSPSSRLFLNIAYAEPAQVLGREMLAGAMSAGQESLALLRAAGWPHLTEADSRRIPSIQTDGQGGHTDLIDWPTLIPARLAVLRRVFERFSRHPDTSLAGDFRQFCIDGGEALESHARYETLSSHYCRELGPDSGWQDWPAPLRAPKGAAVHCFAQTHQAEVDFHCFTQWLADRGLGAAQAAARASGMPIGLIADLAIGTDPRGSHAWSRQADILHNVSVGAPPDLIQPLGQSWGITAFSPHALRHSAYAGFIETLRANLRHAGGLRIDHIMGLARMWLVPPGADARAGVYLQYPLNDMLGLLVLEASRHQAIVVGENLGTVKPDFNKRLRERGILGTSVLWFQLETPWPDWSMATSTTHDLPTIEGWWAARDIQWREQLGQLLPDQAQQQRDARAREKAVLLGKLPAGCAAPALDSRAAAAPVTAADLESAAVPGSVENHGLASASEPAPRQAILSYVAQTPGPLVMVPIEDILGVVEQPNLPGTFTPSGPALSREPSTVAAGTPTAHASGHPSWIQRLPQPVEGLLDRPESKQSLQSIMQGRRVVRTESES